MDRILLPAKAAPMEAQSCHDWVTAIKAAWCCSYERALRIWGTRPGLASHPRLPLLELLHPTRRQQLWLTLSCIAGHWNSTWVAALYSPTHKDTHAFRAEWQSEHSRGWGKSWHVCLRLPCTERLAEAKWSGFFIAYTRWFKFFTFPALPATSRTNKALNSSAPCLLSL